MDARPALSGGGTESRSRRELVITQFRGVLVVAPGLTLVAACVAVAFGVNRLVPTVSPLVASVVLGVLVTNVGLASPRTRDGTRFAAKHLLRLGIALLGFQLAVSQVWSLGWPLLILIIATTIVTFCGTEWFARRIGLSPGLGLLVATGFSICGASAIAAMAAVTESEEEDVTIAIALVTVCGSLAIGLLPLVKGPLGLSDPTEFGSWVGASVHDVGQVVATAATAGQVALRAAVVVKLTRVVLLAPLIAIVGLRRRASIGVNDEGTMATRRGPLVPLFVIGFLAAMLARSTGAIPGAFLPRIKGVQQVLMSAGLVGLGTGVRLTEMARVGRRPLVLGLAAWAVIATVSFVGIVIIRPHG